MGNNQAFYGIIKGVKLKAGVQKEAPGPAHVLVEFDTSYDGSKPEDNLIDPNKADTVKTVIIPMIKQQPGLARLNNSYTINETGSSLTITPAAGIRPETILVFIPALGGIRQLSPSEYPVPPAPVKKSDEIPWATRVEAPRASDLPPPMSDNLANAWTTRIEPATVLEIVKLAKDCFSNHTDKQVSDFRTQLGELLATKNPPPRGAEK